MHGRPEARYLPYRRAGGSGAPGVSRPSQSVGRTDIPRAFRWQRTFLAESRPREPVSNSNFVLQVARVSRSELGLENVGHEPDVRLCRDSESGSDACANSECDESRSASVSQARRQAPSVAWLERSADHAAEQH